MIGRCVTASRYVSSWYRAGGKCDLPLPPSFLFLCALWGHFISLRGQLPPSLPLKMAWSVALFLAHPVELAMLAEWIKIVSTVSIFSLLSPFSCDAHERRGRTAPSPSNPPLATAHNSLCGLMMDGWSDTRSTSEYRRLHRQNIRQGLRSRSDEY